jgi:hypothetical protein
MISILGGKSVISPPSRIALMSNMGVITHNATNFPLQALTWITLLPSSSPLPLYTHTRSLGHVATVIVWRLVHYH